MPASERPTHGGRRRGAGRKRGTGGGGSAMAMVWFRAPAELAARIRAYAVEHSLTASGAARRLVERGLAA